MAYNILNDKVIGLTSSEDKHCMKCISRMLCLSIKKCIMKRTNLLDAVMLRPVCNTTFRGAYSFPEVACVQRKKNNDDGAHFVESVCSVDGGECLNDDQTEI